MCATSARSWRRRWATTSCTDQPGRSVGRRQSAGSRLSATDKPGRSPITTSTALALAIVGLQSEALVLGGIFLAALVAARGLPALIYRKLLDARQQHALVERCTR